MTEPSGIISPIFPGSLHFHVGAHGAGRGERVSSAVGCVRRCWGAASHTGNHHPHQGPGKDADRGAGALVLAVSMGPGSLVSSLFMFLISPGQVTVIAYKTMLRFS